MNIRVEEPALNRTLDQLIQVSIYCDSYGLHVCFQESEEEVRWATVVPVTPNFDLGRNSAPELRYLSPEF